MQTLFKRFEKTIATLLVIVMPTLMSAQSGAITTTEPSVSTFNIAVNVGPIAVSLQMTKPVRAQAGIWDTLHIDARDDTQSPAFHGTLDAIGQAPDEATLFGGFLPATVILKNDLLAGLTFNQAVADAQAKTGVTIISFQDATLAEYGLLLALIAIVCLDSMQKVSPPLSSELSAISTKMVSANSAATGGSPIP